MAVKKAQKVRGKMIWRQNKFPLIGITLFALIGVTLLATIYAAPGGKSGKPPKGGGVVVVTSPTPTGTQAAPRTSNLNFSLFATHPYASKAGFTSSSVNYYTGVKLCTTGAAFCPVGQTLTDIGISASGELVAGYGEWTANVDSFGVPEGRVGVVPLNLATKTWGPITVAGSEAIDVIREINGKIYAPTTDPSDTLGSKSGYVTNANGPWQLVWDKAGAVHTLDVASSNGSDILTVGAIGNPDRAAAWRSTDNGQTFTMTTSNTGSTDTGWERYYFAGIANGQLKVSAAGVNPSVPAKTFNGTSWSDTRQTICYGRLAQDVVSYEGKLLCNWTGTTSSGGVSVTSPCIYSGSLCAFDGTTAADIRFTTATGNTVSDMYVRDGSLYVLSPDGHVYSTSSLANTWKCLGQFNIANGEASSIAVYNDNIYIGSSNGKIFKSDIPISQIQ